ncbi:MAG: hypothetical protein LBJ36_06505 [Synergistaceae bacterium]|jgi:hypothetical protein|nr:hypothetical protein [Synergistaceae bacterium]
MSLSGIMPGVTKELSDKKLAMVFHRLKLIGYVLRRHLPQEEIGHL